MGRERQFGAARSNHPRFRSPRDGSRPALPPAGVDRPRRCIRAAIPVPPAAACSSRAARRCRWQAGASAAAWQPLRRSAAEQAAQPGPQAGQQARWRRGRRDHHAVARLSQLPPRINPKCLIRFAEGADQRPLQAEGEHAAAAAARDRDRDRDRRDSDAVCARASGAADAAGGPRARADRAAARLARADDPSADRRGAGANAVDRGRRRDARAVRAALAAAAARRRARFRPAPAIRSRSVPTGSRRCGARRHRRPRSGG